MQVSWIDPDEVRELLRQIEGPRKGGNGSVWEVHTLPAAPLAETPVEPLVAEDPAPEPAAAEASLSEVRPGPANAELWRIRERLRALRDKAQTAGILSRPPAAEAPPVTNEVTAGEAEPVPVEVPDPEPEPPFQEVQAEAASSSEEAPPETVEEAAPEPVAAEEPLQAPAPGPFESAFEPLFAIPAAPSTEPLDEPEPEAAVPLPQEPPPVVEEEPPEVPAGLPFVVSSLGLSERLNGVATWVCTRLRTNEVLLVDDYGDVLWGAQGQTALVLSAMMAWHSAQRASASATCIDPQRIDKPLGPDRALTVLPMRTRYGVVSLAVIQNKPVSDSDAAAIRTALALAVEGPNEARPAEGA